MRAALAAAVLAPTLLIAGCSSGTTTSDNSLPEPQAVAPQDSVTGTESGQSAPAEETAPRDVIRTGTVWVVVSDLAAQQATVESITRDSGGYVQSVNTGANRTPCLASGSPDGTVTDDAVVAPCPPSTGDAGLVTLTVRVPVATFDDVMAKIEALGEVTSLSVTADDVTAQVQDLDARIASQRASVDRVRELMKRAETLDEIVTVEQELASRQAELESMLAQKKSLADAVAMSTITATLADQDAAATIAPADPHWWDAPWETFWNVWHQLLILFAAFLPLMMIGGLVWWLVVIILRRRRRSSAQTAPETAELEVSEP